MKIGLIGYGKMNKLVEQIVKQRGHEIVSIVDIGKEKLNDQLDCYIDFSCAAATTSYFEKICRLQIPIVIGTTGWYDEKEKFLSLCKKYENICIWGSNFSIGVNLFWNILQKSVKIMNSYHNQYDVMLHERHHKYKIDAPSGTAWQTAELICETSVKKNKIVTDLKPSKLEEEQLHVSSLRGGHFFGEHQVIFDSLFDTISITHTAKTREGFAHGALYAAENIHKLKVGLYNFKEILGKQI